MKQDYYELLGVDRAADAPQLKKAYKKQAAKHHPDRNQDDPGAEDRFKAVAEAYQVLSDPQKRELYDRFGFDGLSGAASGGGGVGFSDVGDIFSHFQEIFGGMGFDIGGGFGGRQRARRDAPSRGGNVQTVIELSLQDAAFGCEQEITLKHPTPCEPCQGSGAKDGKVSRCAVCHGSGQTTSRRGAFVLQTTCPSCHGRGAQITDTCPACVGSGEVSKERRVRISIPAGIDHGQTLRLAGKGQEGRRGGPAGHLYVEVRVQQHEHFERDGQDLVYELPVSFPQAALGAKVDVPSLHPEEDPVSLQVPAGVQPGETLVVRGSGVPRLDGRGRGDLVCVVQVEVPKELSPRARELVEELAQSMK